jgi:prepilin signal peptidase PulO-like enzyme (type II secretory pathway)
MELFFLFFIFLLGLIIGSFLNCLVWRVYSGEGMTKRSYCPKCKHQIAWYDNVPVLSFILLKGKCRHCQEKISYQYPLIELVTGLLFLLSWWHIMGTGVPSYEFQVTSLVELLCYWLIVFVMLAIFVFDARWYLIPDKITLPAIAVIFVLNLYLGFNWQNLVISGIIGGSFFLLQFVISRGKWIGGGDIRMGVLMGVALGLTGLAVALFLAYIIGSLVGISLMALGRKKWGSQVPFGIFLSTGCLISLFWGAELANWYLGLLYL